MLDNINPGGADLADLLSTEDLTRDLRAADGTILPIAEREDNNGSANGIGYGRQSRHRVGDLPRPDATRVERSMMEEAWAAYTRGAWLLCQAFLSAMRRRGYGRIVNISSGGGSFAEGLAPITPPMPLRKRHGMLSLSASHSSNEETRKWMKNQHS